MAETYTGALRKSWSTEEKFDSQNASSDVLNQLVMTKYSKIWKMLTHMNKHPSAHLCESMKTTTFNCHNCDNSLAQFTVQCSVEIRVFHCVYSRQKWHSCNNKVSNNPESVFYKNKQIVILGNYNNFIWKLMLSRFCGAVSQRTYFQLRATLVRIHLWIITMAIRTLCHHTYLIPMSSAGEIKAI